MTELIREYWDWFLFDTLVWTGILIGAALLLRRPVAKHLGAGAAYALWLLPLARLLFPPVTLPGWMDPSTFGAVAPGAPALPALPGGFSYSEIVSPMPPATLESPVDLIVPMVIIWFIGAALFMGRRFWLYGLLRRELLQDARPVGEVDNIRLIETPAISGPMAFGVIDKVVALPEGFMASRERQVRDLAIAHELAHHRGRDLLVNVLIQPLFAVHWFNPLGWMGWTAMRRDQEAACDARVVASRSRDERAAYAVIIADFARRPQIAPRPALAAPMACPVLGDKSIIHRLRSLPMTDESRRRRFAARGALAAGVLALPMTASICYGVGSPAIAAELPQLAQPVSPVAAAGQLPIATHAELVSIDADGFAEVYEQRMEEREERAEAIREQAEERRERAVELREHRDEAYAAQRQEWAAGRIAYARSRQQWADSRIEWAEGRAAHASAKANAKAKQKQAHAAAHANWGEDVGNAMGEAMAVAFNQIPEVIEDCRYPANPVTPIESNGRTIMYVCDTAGDRIALQALEQARRGIETNDRMSRQMRKEILRDIDAEIRELERTIGI